jgi:hypothetical protein
MTAKAGDSGAEIKARGSTVSSFFTVQYLIVKPVIADPPACEKYHYLRRQAKNGMRRRLFNHCAHSLCYRGLEENSAKAVLASCEMHHLLPLSLGGTNHIVNRVMVQRRLHAACHKFIDAMLDGLKAFVLVHPTAEKIWIPYPYGPVEVRYGGKLFTELHI